MDLFLKKHSSQDVTGVVWIIVLFLSAVWTLILTAPIHCRGSTGEYVMQCYISLCKWRNKLADGLSSHFWWTITEAKHTAKMGWKSCKNYEKGNYFNYVNFCSKTDENKLNKRIIYSNLLSRAYVSSIIVQNNINIWYFYIYIYIYIL